MSYKVTLNVSLNGEVSEKDVKEFVEFSLNSTAISCSVSSVEKEPEEDEDYELIHCEMCDEEKAVEKGTWALDAGLCEPCYVESQGG